MTDRFSPPDKSRMRRAIRGAERALEHEDVPVGALVVHAGEVIGVGHNERQLRQDPTAHAELLALREAARRLGSWRPLESVLHPALRPAAMAARGLVPSPAPPAARGPGPRGRLPRRARGAASHPPA